MSSERAPTSTLVFICDGCGREALAGSKDLLENWEKRGATEGKDERGVHRLAWRADYCGGCK